jgi:phosphoenolpyruvate phosphomutase-like protein
VTLEEAARKAIDVSGTGIVLTGRSEGFIVGRPDLNETIRRLTAYAEAGADCLYAPGTRNKAEISAVFQLYASARSTSSTVRSLAPRTCDVDSGTGQTTIWQPWPQATRRGDDIFISSGRKL